MRIPEYHFHLFSPQGLRRLLERNGFVLKQVATASGTGTEAGIRAIAGRLKEGVLSIELLGNALVVSAEAKQPSAKKSGSL